MALGAVLVKYLIRNQFVLLCFCKMVSKRNLLKMKCVQKSFGVICFFRFVTGRSKRIFKQLMAFGHCCFFYHRVFQFE